MITKILLIITFLFTGSFTVAGELKDSDKYFDYKGNRHKDFRYTFKERDHTIKEQFVDIAIIFGIATTFYPITQPEILDGSTGSWKKYRRNFGRLVFDQDERFWNFFVHPFTGSQMYLYYRAKGYSKIDSMKMNFISSALFEFVVETFSEPASMQDLFNTPVLGSIFGLGIESLSFYLLNSGSTLGKIVGHIINPCTLMWFYDGKMRITPHISPNGTNGISFVMEF